MKNFVLGFIFNPHQDQVLLLKKRSSDSYNPNQWNGVGGKIEDLEDPCSAMSREVYEETNLSVSKQDWQRIGNITDHQTFKVHVFVTQHPLDKAKQLTDEEIKAFSQIEVNQLARQGHLAGDVWEILLPWLEGESLVLKSL